jgi:hypothetical protein
MAEVVSETEKAGRDLVRCALRRRAKAQRARAAAFILIRQRWDHGDGLASSPMTIGVSIQGCRSTQPDAGLVLDADDALRVRIDNEVDPLAGEFVRNFEEPTIVGDGAIFAHQTLDGDCSFNEPGRSRENEPRYASDNGGRNNASCINGMVRSGLS